MGLEQCCGKKPKMNVQSPVEHRTKTKMHPDMVSYC